MTVLRGVASEEEGRTAVREVSAKEIPFIKIWDANPLEDMRNTRTISRVYLRGHEVDREGLGARWTGGD